MNKNFIGGKKACAILGVHYKTLYNWAEKGQIEVVRTPGGKRMYNVSKYIGDNINIQPEEKIAKKKICYCRVSTSKQKDDLQRQIKYMKERYPKHEIWTDIGSGINWKRKKFNKIFQFAKDGLIDEVVVAHRDRLCRFAFDMAQNILKMHDVKLVVINSVDKTIDEDMCDDLMSIIQIYICRKNGRRKYTSGKNIQKIKDKLEEIVPTEPTNVNQGACVETSQSKQYQNLTDSNTMTESLTSRITSLEEKLVIVCANMG